MRFITRKVAAVAVTAAIMAPAAAQAATQFSWSWRKSGDTVTYSTLNSIGGTTRVNDLVTWCTWGQSVHSGDFSFSGTVTKRQECTFGVNKVTVTLG